MSQRRQVLGGRDKSNNTPGANPRTRAHRTVMKLRTGGSTAAVARLLQPSARFVLLSRTSLSCTDQTRLSWALLRLLMPLWHRYPVTTAVVVAANARHRAWGQRHRAVSPVRPVALIPIRT